MLIMIKDDLYRYCGIGKGFRIVHFAHIVVNPSAVISENFNICQGCLVGNSGGRNAGVPLIGNRVCMQPGSVIVGGGKNWR